MEASKQVAVSPVNRLKQVMASPSVQEQFKNALNENSTQISSASSQGGPGGGGETGMPAWARAMRDQQTNRHRRQLAIHSISQGDRGGASATPDIKERND